MAGALAASSVVWRALGNDSAYSDRCLKAARELYGQARKFEGCYTAKFKCALSQSSRETAVGTLLAY
jgi:hypothetical protein